MVECWGGTTRQSRQRSDSSCQLCHTTSSVISCQQQQEQDGGVYQSHRSRVSALNIPVIDRRNTYGWETSLPMDWNLYKAAQLPMLMYKPGVMTAVTTQANLSTLVVFTEITLTCSIERGLVYQDFYCIAGVSIWTTLMRATELETFNKCF